MTIQFWKWTNKWMWIATVVVVLLASRSWVTTTTAFNLEPRIALRKQGPIGSYFGLAVSPHQILVDDHQIDSTLLVGAPLDTYGTDYTKATGVLYQCPFTSKSDDCVKVHDIPTNRDARSLAEAAGQWLGVSVFSQGPGKIPHSKMLLTYLYEVEIVVSNSLLHIHCYQSRTSVKPLNGSLTSMATIKNVQSWPRHQWLRGLIMCDSAGDILMIFRRHHSRWWSFEGPKIQFKNVILFSLVVIFCTTHFLFAELCLLTHTDSFIYVTVVWNIFKKSADFLCILFKKILLTNCTTIILYFLAPCLYLSI